MEGISDDAWMGIGGDGVLDRSDGVVLVGTEREVIDAVLEQNLDLSVLLLVVSPQHLQVLSQLGHSLTEVFVLGC
jgi:hypothetical protein